MSQIGKILPNLDQNGTKLLNLTVLQRIDPTIEEILMTAAHVAFYEFNIELNQWSRKDVEGSLFVVKRNAQPMFQFIVMNRRNTENLIENLSWDFEFELQVPYLLYRNAAQEVNGIWFYNSRECEDAANLINRLLSDYSKSMAQPKAPSRKSEFEDIEGVPSMTSYVGQIESLPPSRNSTDVAEGFFRKDVAEDSSFTNFFNVATTLGNTQSNMVRPGQPHHPSPTPNSISALQLPSTTAVSTVPLVRPHDTTDLSRTSSQIANLVKPSTFYNPPASSSSSAYMMPTISSTPTAPLQQPSTAVQRPYGAPLLQPFPPPNPPPSLTPTGPSNYGPVIDRETVRQTLLLFAQNDQVIDLFYQALQKVHET